MLAQKLIFHCKGIMFFARIALIDIDMEGLFTVEYYKPINISSVALFLRRAGPREVLNQAVEAARGEGEEYERGWTPLSLGGQGSPPENFVKSMYLRTHFKPF